MIKQFFKKVLISYLIIICCLFTPIYRAYAASAVGWAFNSFDVATSVVTALKNGASASVAVAKSPISQKIGKGILGGVIAGAAIPLAISQLTGIALEAVDWVLDPANNAIKYKPKGVTSVTSWQEYGSGSLGTFDTKEALCSAIAAKYGNGRVVSITDIDGTNMRCTYSTNYGDSSNWIKPVTVPVDWKSIPIPTVADKVYDNAKTDSASKSIVNDAVKDYVNEGSADTALDNAKADADASHACGSGTHWTGSACVADTPTTPTDTPFDPTDIIDAIGKVFDAVMSLPDVINNALDDLLVDIKDFFQPVITKFTDFVDWFQKDPDLPPVDNTPLVKDDKDSSFVDEYANKSYVNFSGQCPAPPVFNIFGSQITFPMEIVCKACEQMSWVFISFAWLRAVMIVFFASKG